MHARSYVDVCAYTWFCTGLSYTRINMYICVYMHMCTHEYTHIHTYVCSCMHQYMYMYIFINNNQQKNTPHPRAATESPAVAPPLSLPPLPPSPPPAASLLAEHSDACEGVRKPMYICTCVCVGI